MKNVIVKYSLYSSATMLVLFTISTVFMNDLSYAIQEYWGYGSIVLAVSFVYFGIRYYRDNVNDNTLSFIEGLKLGILIIAIPSILFGLFNVFYTEVINPEFMDDYYNQHVENLRATVSPEEFEVQFSKMESEKEMFQNPLFNFLLMGFTVFFIGLIGTVISTLILKRD